MENLNYNCELKITVHRETQKGNKFNYDIVYFDINHDSYNSYNISEDFYSVSNYNEIISILSDVLLILGSIIDEIHITDYSDNDLSDCVLLNLIAKCCTDFCNSHSQKNKYPKLKFQFSFRSRYSCSRENLIFKYTDLNKFNADLKYYYDVFNNIKTSMFSENSNVLEILKNINSGFSNYKILNSELITMDYFLDSVGDKIIKNYDKIYDWFGILYSSEIYKRHKRYHLCIIRSDGVFRQINHYKQNINQHIKLCIINKYLEYMKIKTCSFWYNIHHYFSSDNYINKNNIAVRYIYVHLNIKMLRNSKLNNIIQCYYSSIPNKVTQIVVIIVLNKLLANLLSDCKNSKCCLYYLPTYKTKRKIITKNMNILKYFNDLCKHKTYKNKYNKYMLINTLYLMHINNISSELILIYMKYYLYN